MATCSKPSCPRPGRFVLSYDYAARIVEVWNRGVGELSPHLYLMCALCADRIRPPLGWELKDHRSDETLLFGESA